MEKWKGTDKKGYIYSYDLYACIIIDGPSNLDRYYDDLHFALAILTGALKLHIYVAGGI